MCWVIYKHRFANIIDILEMTQVITPIYVFHKNGAQNVICAHQSSVMHTLNNINISSKGRSIRQENMRILKIHSRIVWLNARCSMSWLFVTGRVWFTDHRSVDNQNIGYTRHTSSDAGWTAICRHYNRKHANRTSYTI